MCKVGEINLSYECLTSPETRQVLVSLHNTNPTLHEKLFAPPLSVPLPPPPSGENGSYPEDQGHEEDEMFVDSSLSIREVVAQVADEIPGESVDFSGDEDEGIDGFGCENSRGSAGSLEAFDPKLATLYWPRWDGYAVGS